MGPGAFGEGEGAGDVGAEPAPVDEFGDGAHPGLVVLDGQVRGADLCLLRRGPGVLGARQQGDEDTAGAEHAHGTNGVLSAEGVEDNVVTRRCRCR